MPVVFYHPSLNVKHVFRYCQMALREGQNCSQLRTTAVAIFSAWHALPLKGLIHTLSPPSNLSADVTPLRLLWHIYLITQTLNLLTYIPYPPLLFNFHDDLMYQTMYLFLCVCISFSYSNVSSLRDQFCSLLLPKHLEQFLTYYLKKIKIHMQWSTVKSWALTSVLCASSSRPQIK